MIHIVTGGGFWGGGWGGGIFSFVVDCKQTGCSSVQMCVVTNYNQSWCSSVDDHIVTGGGFGGGVGGDIFVRCWLQTDRMFFGTDVCCNKLQPKLMFFRWMIHIVTGGIFVRWWLQTDESSSVWMFFFFATWLKKTWLRFACAAFLHSFPVKHTTPSGGRSLVVVAVVN